MWWSEYWVWLSGALVLAILEVILPGYVLLGFAVGAAVVGGVLFVGLLGGSLPILLVAFAVVSLLAWLGLRKALGVRQGQVRNIDHDING
jgi:membrane protein implicated in regulation of membrane protease activity